MGKLKVALASAPVKTRDIEFNMQAMIDVMKKVDAAGGAVYFQCGSIAADLPSGISDAIIVEI